MVDRFAVVLVGPERNDTSVRADEIAACDEEGVTRHAPPADGS